MKFVSPTLCLAILLCLESCSRSSGTPPPPPVNNSYIPVDQANRMIKSYLNSIGYPESEEIRSWKVEADGIRNYLANPTITDIKIFMAHTMEYINSGGEGRKPRAGELALTPIIVGVNKDGHYVYLPGKLVVDNAAPCPRLCSYHDYLD